MWGRWAVMKEKPQAAGILSKLLSNKVITKNSMKEAMKNLASAGISKDELLMIFGDLQEKHATSNMLYCTDTEGLAMDGVITSVLREHPGLLNVVLDHYSNKKNRYQMAVELQKKNPDVCLRTCQNRINTWLKTAEFMLYKPMCGIFDINANRFESFHNKYD